MVAEDAGIGTLEQILMGNLVENTEYFYRAHAQNSAGEAWADEIFTFRTIDTKFTEETVDGLLLWLDATDLDGDGERDAISDSQKISIWVDKSSSEKHAAQSLMSKMPAYKRYGFGSMPAIEFESGNSMFVGTLRNLSGPLNIFAVTEGEGVLVGADDGLSSWTFDARTASRIISFRGEDDPLQQVTLGMDPRTGFGLLTGKVGEILMFDRLLESAEREKIEGYLAHKWAIQEDLAFSGYSVSDGLILYYPFNEDGGSVAEDYSPNLRHGTVVDGDLGTSGKFFSGIGLDAISPSTAKIDLGYNPLELEQTNWTVSSWFLSPINHPDDQVTSDYALFESPGLSYLYFDKSSSNQLFLNDRNPPSPDFFASSLSGSINDPDWHLVTLTSALNQFIVYIDGVEVTRYTGSSAGSLGIISLGNLSSNDGRFAPAMDDFRVYNRTLSPEEVLTLYGNGDGDFGTHTYSQFPPTFDNVPEILLPKEAIAHWKFDNLEGTEVLDSSGFENHAEVGNQDTNFDLFLNNSTEGRNGKAISFQNDITVQCILDETEESTSLSDSFSLSFWLNTQDRDASIVSSGRFNIYLADGYLNSNLYIGSRWNSTEPILIPFGSWLHIVLLWDGNKIRLYINNEEAVPPINAKGKLTGSPRVQLGDTSNEGYGEFEGLIDDFRIYAHALNPQERENAFNFESSAMVATFGEEFSYQIQSLKGPTDFNASGLPLGLSIDPNSGIIYGTPLEAGLDFNVSILASNASGSDEENMTFFVIPSTQSIIFEEIKSVTYGAPPIDLNWTSTSDLPVTVQILEGAEFAELSSNTMPTSIEILKAGNVKIQASQDGDGNQTYLSAPKVINEFVISKRN